MKMLSLITAYVVRENEQYRYKLVGKGEKYLVQHNESEDAAMKVIEFLTPYAKEPVKIKQVTLLKESVELIHYGDADFVFSVRIEFVLIEENGKERKKSRTIYVTNDSINEALDTTKEWMSGFLSDSAITSIVRTKIIDVIT